MSFHHAAVSKGLMMGCALTSIAASIFDIKHYLHLQLVPHLSRYHQYWRLPVHHLAISSSSELLLAELLLYHASVPVERMFGSAKFASFAVVSLLTSTILEFGSLLLLNRFGLNVLPSGPIALVFSILYQYSRIVPDAYHFKVFGVTLTDKVFVYFLGIQLAISQQPGSLSVALSGILAGQLYRSDVLGLKTFRLPRHLQRFASRYILPLVGSTKPPRRPNRAFPEDSSMPSLSRSSTSRSQDDTEVVTTAPPSTSDSDRRTTRTTDQADQARVVATAAAAANVLPSVREWVDEFTGRAERERVAATSGLRVPTDNEIAQLTSIFPDLRREVIVGALQRSPNVESAAETLLTTQG